MGEDDVRMLVLAGVARQAKGSQPTAKWLRLWADAIAPLSPEEVRTWCRMQWERATGQPVEESTLLASFWGMAAVSAPGLPTMLGEWAWRLTKAGQHKLAHAAIQAIGMIAAGQQEPAREPDGANDPTVTEELPAGPALADEAIGQLQRLKARIRHDRSIPEQIEQILSIAAFDERLGRAAQFGLGDIPHAPGHLLGTGDLEALPLFQHAHIKRRVDQ